MTRVACFIAASSLLVFLFFPLPLNSSAEERLYSNSSAKYNREELAQMLAPIALFPDVLLTRILMASTYPDEVVEADQWVKMNSELTGDHLDTVLLDKDWAPSVKVLCHFPEVLNLMSERIVETTAVGKAFLVQDGEVIEVIQELRALAYAQDNLSSTFEQTVIVDGETFIIQPADPRFIYIPYYDTSLIFGAWRYPGHPPYCWAPGKIRINRKIFYRPNFYTGFTLSAWSFLDWHRHHIYINPRKRPRFARQETWWTKPGPWRHVPRHKRRIVHHDAHNAGKPDRKPYSAGDFHRGKHEPVVPADHEGFKLPSRFIPLDDQRSRFQLPDRTMPWEGDSNTVQDRKKNEQPEHGDHQRRVRKPERKKYEQAHRDQSEGKAFGSKRTNKIKKGTIHDLGQGLGTGSKSGFQLRSIGESRLQQRDERERRKRNHDSVFEQTDHGGREHQLGRHEPVSRQSGREDSGPTGDIRHGNGIIGKDDFRLR